MSEVLAILGYMELELMQSEVIFVQDGVTLVYID